jgi:inner membrane organizing system protein 1
MSESKLSKSEEELGQKWDRCIQDTLIKTASGIGLGIVFSVALFKRRPFPVIFGELSLESCTKED